MKILLFASGYNGMCQRMHRELEADNHQISIELSADEQHMMDAVNQFQPSLIICPFLKHRVPESIWRKHLCLIIHPGIEGDRGPSSLDWAITDQATHWGVTVLQANTEMDAGDIWATKNFPVRNAAKASIYRRDVISTAVELIKQILIDAIQKPDFFPRPLDYNNPAVKGQLMPLMRQDSRTIAWDKDTTATIVKKINAADSFPGVLDNIAGNAVYLYGARAEYNLYKDATVGELVGHRDGAICRATMDGSVWIRQLKMAPHDEKVFFKLPALHVVTQQFPNGEQFSHLKALSSRVQNDINVEVNQQVAYVKFDFYNGAMNTEHCIALLNTLRELRARTDIRVIALLGGEDFWSNGIHLNCIEAHANPAHESWRNINAIDDVIYEIITMDNKITVAALCNNAGAGGAIMPLACDLICARNGVVLNPHYLTMGLYGSEYWTYLLPKRVGKNKAQELIEGCMPLLVSQAQSIGLVDKVFAEDWNFYLQALQLECEEIATDAYYWPMLATKNATRIADETKQPLASYRTAELQHMQATFNNPQSDYHSLRHNFVYKISCGTTPARLTYKLTEEKITQIA